MIDINAMRNSKVVAPELNSLGKLNMAFDESLKHSADFGGEAIPENKLCDGLIVSKFKDAAYTVIDSPYGVYLRWQEAIYTAVALDLDRTMSKTQILCLVVPVFQKYLYDRLVNCHDGEELKTTLDIMMALATYQFVYLRLVDSKFASTAHDVLPIISEARESNVKSDCLLKQYKDAMIKPMFDISRVVPKRALVNKDMYDAICTFLKELWADMFEPAPRNKATFDFDNIELLYSKLTAELRGWVLQLAPEPLGALVEYVSSLPS